MDVLNFIPWKSLYVLLLLFIQYLCKASYDDPNCIVDASLPATANDNFIDCSAKVQVKLGRTECCTIDDTKGCCKPGNRWEQLKLIGVCLGATTVGLAIILIYCLWIRRSNHPKLVQCRMSCENKYHEMQENCSCIPCCRWRVEMRRQKEELKKREAEFSMFGLPVEAARAQMTF